MLKQKKKLRINEEKESPKTLNPMEFEEHLSNLYKQHKLLFSHQYKLSSSHPDFQMQRTYRRNWCNRIEKLVSHPVKEDRYWKHSGGKWNKSFWWRDKVKEYCKWNNWTMESTYKFSIVYMSLVHWATLFTAASRI